MLDNIFNVFSKRNEISQNNHTSITESFKMRYLMILKEYFGNSTPDIFIKMHKKLTFLHGKIRLSTNQYANEGEDLLEFLLNCKDEYLLDTIEYVFQIQDFSQTQNEDELIRQINEFLEIDNLPYYLTSTVWEEVDSSFYGNTYNSRRIKEYPKIIRKDSDVLHENSIKPVLSLLRQPDLLNANEEFMLSLDDYKKGKYRDSVTKYCSALESTLKVICFRNKLEYNENITIRPLLKIIIDNSNLDSFWEQPILLIATIRNRLSSSHGAGIKDKILPKHIAKYIINATASAILLLCDEAYELNKPE